MTPHTVCNITLMLLKSILTINNSLCTKLWPGTKPKLITNKKRIFHCDSMKWKYLINLMDDSSWSFMTCHCDYMALAQQDDLFFVKVLKEHSGILWPSSFALHLSTHKSGLMWNFEVVYRTHQELMGNWKIANNNQPYPRWSSKIWKNQERIQYQYKTIAY